MCQNPSVHHYVRLTQTQVSVRNWHIQCIYQTHSSKLESVRYGGQTIAHHCEIPLLLTEAFSLYDYTWQGFLNFITFNDSNTSMAKRRLQKSVIILLHSLLTTDLLLTMVFNIALSLTDGGQLSK